MKRLKLVAVISSLAVLLLTTLAWLGAQAITAPVRRAAGNLPPGLQGQPVQFHSRSGALIRGWLLSGLKGGGAVILMHGFRSDRASMMGRARFLASRGYSVLLFDFQAHGESTGERITIGYLESRDAQAAVQFLRERLPGEKIGVIGTSMGGAAAVLSTPPLGVEAMVLEMVYPTIEEAVADRLKMRAGGGAGRLSPLLTRPMKRVLGVGAEQLRPIEHVGEIAQPKLFIAGAEDRHTTLAEAERLFGAAREPKRMWVVEGVAHEDLHVRSQEEYERRVLAFFGKHLRP